MDKDRQTRFPVDKEPLGDKTFRFACHPGVSCFTTCCRDLTLYLYPYDILRLKRSLRLHSEEFLNRYAGVVRGENPYFPSVVLRMKEDDARSCPFLDPAVGCTVYDDRPSSCRTYPLERGVERVEGGRRLLEHYFLTRHPYCRGHEEKRTWTVKEWVRDQNLLLYNAMDDRWAEMEVLFASNPWKGEGAAGPKQQLAFMVCYNLDRFREYVEQHDLLSRFRLDKARKRAIATDDEPLLHFGFDWLAYILTDAPTLVPR